jgi:hypothetical protein
MKINKKDLVKIIHESIKSVHENNDSEDIPFPPYEQKADKKLSGLEKADYIALGLYNALAGLGDPFDGYAELAFEISQLIGAHLENR